MQLWWIVAETGNSHLLIGLHPGRGIPESDSDSAGSPTLHAARRGCPILARHPDFHEACRTLWAHCRRSRITGGSTLQSNTVNSCASNSVTGQTVCSSNVTDVYLITGSTLNTTLASDAN